MEQPQDDCEEVGLFSPPPKVQGMTTLDRDAFTKTIQAPVIKVKKELIHIVMKNLKHRILKRPKLKTIIEDPSDEDHKKIVLDPFLVTSEDAFDERDHEFFKKFQISPQICQADLQVTYDNLKTDEILKAILPKGQDVTTGFTRVGHIAHMNLRDHQLPYKNLIGQVILDKNPGLTSVVNKTNIIDSTYRNFQMEVLAGEENMITKVKENGIAYEFDFSKVYWNSRLGTEHDRITGLLKSGDVVFDVFAGVGPFAIPAAKRKCIVYANDLNPESYKWLLHNCKLNKVDKKVQPFNVDGREFIRTVIKKELSGYIKSFTTERENHLHIVMNLPAMAVEFLDAFRHLLDMEYCSEDILPTVHCYGFSKDDNPEKDIRKQAEQYLGTVLDSCSVHLVRNVAPNKEMMCISFKLPAKVLFANQLDCAGEPALKRFRKDEESTEKESTR
ncbi:PREDICTED: tRNA (guanine(37)-N1)-methyltransferase [Nanorana parkeri]|uniref:tRNA (guanine(37)-N1)-methyltransferase n=1 Tax=Nanorana parkeri TaxID=125878 RepID=UPI0008550CA2|nr:PREDICTED: tRNA (guanine(37)-N1)-methyltransferase [Nanorana parkeri]